MIIVIHHKDAAKYRRNGFYVYNIDRRTVIGNPFYMTDETKRNEVCDKYEAYFHQQILHNSDFMAAIAEIYNKAKEQHVALACWCKPKRCHGDTIKTYIDEILKSGEDWQTWLNKIKE